MSRPVLAAVLLLLAPLASVVAQSADAAAAATKQDPQTAYNELVKAFNKAISDWQTERAAAFKKAQETGEKPPASVMAPPTKEFIAKAQELAGDHAGKDDAVQFLAFIVKNASNERNAVKKAIETLTSDHAKSPAIAEVLPHMPNALRFASKQVMELLDQVATDGANADCKAQALVTRGGLRLQMAQTDEDRKAAEKDLRDVAATSKNPELLAQVKDALFEIEHLQVGCTAPEVAGVDVEGSAFKLSDYRGKVVLLDFWGFW